MDEAPDYLIEQLYQARAENASQRKKIENYRGSIILIGSLIPFLLILAFDKPTKTQPTSCQALKYFLDTTSDENEAGFAEIRKVLEAKVAACPEEDVVDSNER